MKEKIDTIKKAAAAEIINNNQMLESYRIKYLSRNSVLNELFDDFKNVSNELKKEIGKELNILKQYIEQKYNSSKLLLENKNEKSESKEDLSKPTNFIQLGKKHPLTLVKNEIITIFNSIGFELSNGPEIEDDWHNFSALNFPENHPARDMQDTFFINNDWALRTHTSSVQVRVMENQKPPIRTISPGRVYRNESISARSNCFFHQIEGLCIDKNTSFADLKQTLYYFVSKFFGERNIRFRASYFPFTEISAEMDIYLGKDTEEDYKLTKGTGWLEIMGCGMVDPNVLKNCGINPEIYSGYAFGMGIDRIAMLKYGIKDIRNFYENDIRLAKQFESL